MTREEKRKFLKSYYLGRTHKILSSQENRLKIEKALCTVNDMELQIILRDKYIHSYTSAYICNKFHISNATLYRYIDKALDAMQIE